ncbi:MAG: phosphomannomutase/phosphoglucomutase [Alteromonadaceae bacterium]|nr:phosphomannomutase/phosphoglucomutase [Alteromonadaceae bacterium]
MKFGKKKAEDTSAVEDKAAGQKKKRFVGKADKGHDAQPGKLKRLSSVAAGQALVLVLAAVAITALLHFLVLTPSAREAHQQAQARQANVAQQILNRFFSERQAQVEAVASQAYVADSLAAGVAPDTLASQLQQALPGAQGIFVFPRRAIPRTGNTDTLLGFAGLELLRRAEQGRSLVPDAFPRDNRWYFQFAAPVADPDTGRVTGTMLAVYQAGDIRPLLSPEQTGLQGRLSLVQTVSGNSRTVIAAGNGSGSETTRTLLNPDWSVAYTPAARPQPAVGMVPIGLFVGLPMVLAIIVSWLLLAGAQRGLRQDMTALVQWSHKVFGGEKVKLPNFRWDMVAATGEVFYRLSQVVEKRVAKAGENAKPKAAPRAKSGATETAGEEGPLFQDNDVPDIDMLDGDEDVLGFGKAGDSASGGGDDAPMFEDDLLDVAENRPPNLTIEQEIFRAYDIRGIVGESLSAEVVEVIGKAIGSEAGDRGVTSLCIGYDGRHSSPELAEALARGVMATGCNVIHIGAVPTPVLYFATHQLQTGSGVMVTGSHNPANYNGLKIMLGGETLSGDAIQKLYQRTQTADFNTGQGEQSREDVRRAYLDRIVGDIAVAAPLKVVVDAGNGIAGELGPLLIEELGCEVVPLYCEVDGNFPNHHPDPGKPANLKDLIAKVNETGADLGLAFDGDGDRLGVVTNTGKIIWPDRLMMLLAKDVVSRNPGADVLYDVKCSRRLAGVISEAGGRPIMWKTGHSLMKAKMKETGALLAGEMSGHVFFGERWYGFDDGLYTAARLLEILGIEDRHSDDVFADFPEDISTPELNVEVTESEKFGIIERLGEQGDFGDGSISNIDGIRVDYTDGWGLCRASNTTPMLVLRFEAETEDALERIKAVFREQLEKAAPTVNPDF